MKKLNIIFLLILLCQQNNIKSEWNSLNIFLSFVIAYAWYNAGVSVTKNKTQVLLNSLFNSIQSDKNIKKEQILQKISETITTIDII